MFQEKTDGADGLILGRRSSLLLTIVGAFLIAAYSYSSLLILYALEFPIDFRWLLFLAYVIGIGLVITGVTLYVRSAQLGALPLLKPYLAVGLALLTVNIFGHIFETLRLALSMGYPYALHSFLVALLRMAWWFSRLTWFAGVAGWLVLFVGRSAWLKSLRASRLFKIAHYLLALGTIVTLMSLAFTISGPFFLPEGQFPFYEPLRVYLAYCAYVYPFGVFGLTFGWASVTPVYLSKYPLLLPILYATFLVTMAVLFLIPI